MDEPIFIDEILKIQAQIIDMNFQIASKSKPYAIIQLNYDMISDDPLQKFHFFKIPNNELRYFKKDYMFEGVEPTPEYLRVMSCTPTIDSTFVIYTSDDSNIRNAIINVHKKFVTPQKLTHFACLPISPCFPHFSQYMNNCYPNSNQSAIYHITLGLVTVENSQQLPLFIKLFNDAAKATHWAEDRQITFPKLGYFGPSQNCCKVLFADPVGPIIDSLREFQENFAKRLRDEGFTRISGFLKPIYHLTLSSRKTIDASKAISSYTPPPPISVNEIRFVQRFSNDPDGFYLTRASYKFSNEPSIDI